MANQLSVISLFTGAGGLDLGFEAAGFATRAAVELDPVCVRTLRANRPGWGVIERSIQEVPTEQLLVTANLREGDLDVLIGGPPCQPFSKSAYWATGDTKRLKDPRASALEEYLRIVFEAKPKAFLIENVPGLGYSGKAEGMRLLSRVVADMNAQFGTHYQLHTAILNAAEYGVPQERRRLFVVAHRDGLNFTFPEATHAGGSRPPGLELSVMPPEPHRTAWDAIGDLEDDQSAELAVRGRWAELLPTIPEGHNYLHHTERGAGLALFGWRRRYWSFLLKLAKQLPSWTITAQPGPAIGPFHWKNRRLSRTELARLQTFPDNYTIQGSLSDAQRQLGNAVPSALAERLALAMRHQFFGDRTAAGRRATLVPQRRLPVPAAEQPAAVPPKYLPLVGRHEAHPGTGRGYAASKWNRIEQRIGEN